MRLCRRKPLSPFRMRGAVFATPPADKALARCDETRHGAERLKGSHPWDRDRTDRVAAVDLRLSARVRRPLRACWAQHDLRRTSDGCEDVGLDAEHDRNQDLVAVQVMRWCPRAAAVRDSVIRGSATD